MMPSEPWLASAVGPPTIIFGAGEQADHVIRLLESMGADVNKLVLFDDGYPARRSGPAGRPICGRIDDGLRACRERPSQPAIVAIGTKGAAFRYGVFRRLIAAGISIPSVIHPRANVAPTVVLGQNCIIMPGCTLAKQVAIGAMCCLFSSVTLEHDTTVGDNCFLGPAVVTAGHVTIHAHAFIGAGAVIGPGITIGTRALIGAGAVVVRDIPEGVIAAGVPARVLREAPPGCDVPTRAQLESIAAL
jgi:sugar O-acyltransferase (sialic acid O-acetyltransferase NeuD family)